MVALNISHGRATVAVVAVVAHALVTGPLDEQMCLQFNYTDSGDFRPTYTPD